MQQLWPTRSGSVGDQILWARWSVPARRSVPRRGADPVGLRPCAVVQAQDASSSWVVVIVAIMAKVPSITSSE